MPQPTMKQVLAHLAAHKPTVPDGLIAGRATTLLRAWGNHGQRDRISRSLVCMVRRGTARRAGGTKSLAIWEAMVALKLIPGVPAEVRRGVDRPTPQHDASRAVYWRKKAAALEARLRGLEPDEEVKEVPMLTPPILRYFGFARNPVFDEIRSPADVWWSAQHKAAREILLDAAEEARFVRLAGPRGAGKSLVAEDTKAQLAKRDDVILVEPSPTLSGVLNELHLVTAIIQAIKRKVDARDEVFPESQNPVKRALAMRYHLVQQKRAKRKVVLWIDEAHELRANTFLALKRFLDEVAGLGQRLLGIVLIGQTPEAAYNPRARDLSEVTLRLQTLRIQPMNAEIADYLRFKIQRAGGTVSEVITPKALAMIGERCPFPLDANAVFAQLLIDGYGDRVKPIGRDEVEALAPTAEGAGA